MDGDFWLTVLHIGLSQRGHADAFFFFCNGEIASEGGSGCSAVSPRTLRCLRTLHPCGMRAASNHEPQPNAVRWLTSLSQDGYGYASHNYGNDDVNDLEQLDGGSV